MPLHGVRLDDGELGIGQLARLVEHIHGHQGFSQVMHQTRQSGVARLALIETQLVRERDHHGAYRHRVHVGIVVRRFQARQTDQRARVAGHRFADVFHQLFRTARVHGLAHARFLEHGNHRLLGLLANLGSALDFNLGAHGRNFAPGDRRKMHFRIDLRFGFVLRNGYLALRHIEPLADVNPHLLDATGQDALNILGVGNDKPVAPKRVLHPGTAKLLQMHSNGELVNADLFEHGYQPKFSANAVACAPFRAHRWGFRPCHWAACPWKAMSPENRSAGQTTYPPLPPRRRVRPRQSGAPSC